MAEIDETLLERMREIADAVNAFKSEAVQLEAFHTLVGVLADRKRPYANSRDSLKGTGNSDLGKSQPKKSRQQTPKKKSNASVTLVKDLNLRPAGVQAFADFAAEKKPKDNQEKYAVAIYWLEQIANIEGISDAHISTVFRMTDGWREPSGITAGLNMTASRKNTIDTSDHSDLKTTPEGRNFVELDLPKSRD